MAAVCEVVCYTEVRPGLWWKTKASIPWQYSAPPISG